jgi:hypothetical protein
MAIVDNAFPLLRSSIQELAYDAASGTVVAATESNYIFVWSGIDVSLITDADQFPNDEVPQSVPRYFLRIAPLVDDLAKPLSLVLQSPGIIPPSQLHFAVFHEHESLFHKVSVDLKEPTPQFHVAQFCDGPLGVIRSSKADLLPILSSTTSSITSSSTPSLASSSAVINIPLLSRNAPRLPIRLQSYVLVGDASGQICVWDWDRDPVHSADTHAKYPKVPSSQRWQAHDDEAVTVIEVDGAILATGG